MQFAQPSGKAEAVVLLVQHIEHIELARQLAQLLDAMTREEDRVGQVQAPHQLEELHAVDGRHHRIEQDQVQFLSGEDAHRLEGIAGRFRVDAFPHQLELGQGQAI